jgi:mono/diheme cytochrome c family protein
LGGQGDPNPVPEKSRPAGPGLRRRSMFKRLLLLVVLVAILAGLAALVGAYLPTTTPQIAAPAIDEKLAEAGRYAAVLGDCAACHTAPGGQAFAGGLAVASPIGNIYSTNITPDRATGIGAYSLDDFDRAVRHGITPEGGTLYPAMPYPSYAGLTDADVTALYVFFMKSVAPVSAANRPTEIRWPLSLRWPLALWRKAFGPTTGDGVFDAATYKDPVIARGAYLVQGPGHCGSCHTPRAITLQEKGLDERSLTFLSGGQLIDGWVAVSLRGGAADGLGAMSADDIVASLRSGRSIGRAVIGQPMKDVVIHSTQDMTDADLKSIAAYLKTLRSGPAGPMSYTADNKTAADLKAGTTSSRGAELYLDNCSACHRLNGEGEGKTFPAIAGNPSVLASDSSSLIRLILAGGAMPSTATAPSNLGMPGFAWRFSDQEVAQLVTFIRQSWGNAAPAADSAAVAKIRSQIDTEKAKVNDTKPPA